MKITKGKADLYLNQLNYLIVLTLAVPQTSDSWAVINIAMSAPRRSELRLLAKKLFKSVFSKGDDLYV